MLSIFVTRTDSPRKYNGLLGLAVRVTNHTNMPKYLLTSCFLFLNIYLFAQPQPCVEPEMVSLCADACVICDIDGFTGVNNSSVTGEAPPDFCTTFLHAANWIAFIAGSENLTLQVTVSNCQINWGLEIGIYEGLGCENYQQVSICNTDVDNNSVATFSNTVPLVVGQYYYFVMDGSAGDVCNYTVNVTEGTTQVGALQPINSVIGPTEVCPNNPVIFEVPEVEGATFSEWTVNGVIVSDEAQQLEYEFPEPGLYAVCYTAFNVCDTIPPVCKTVTVEHIPPILFDEVICGGDTLVALDSLFYETGNYNFSFINDEGCLQQVVVTLEVIEPVFSSLDLEFCFGDTVFIGPEPFTETGSYEVLLETTMFCDSTVFLDLNTFLCDINGGFADDDLLCNGDNDGQLVFNLADGNLPYQYQWEEETGTGLSGSGVSDVNNTQVIIPDLIAGIYSITVTDAIGNTGVFVGQVFEPISISAELEASEFGAFNLNCHDSNDGSLTVTPSQGVPPYAFQWSNGSQQPSISQLAAGMYSVSIMDSNGCAIELQNELIAPEPLTAGFDLVPANCNPDNSGSITVTTQGGRGPYTYSLDSEEPVSSAIFANLFPNTYSVQIMDNFGCEYTENVQVLPPIRPELDLANQMEFCLGDSLPIPSTVSLPNEITYAWTPADGLSCTDCPLPFVRPLNNVTYTLTVALPNNCVETDSVDINVLKFRKIYIPNAFSPNNDGVNDYFTIYGGKEVTQVLLLEIYDRWGGLVAAYQGGETKQGWDGDFGIKKADIGVYAWRASVEFLDGEVIEYAGDVTLKR